jgi:hypothetical protein
MSEGSQIGRLSFCVAAACALAMSGCATSTVPSHKSYGPELSKAMGGSMHFGGQRFGMQDVSACAACEDRQRLQDYAPYVAGPFMHPRGGTEYAAQQATIQPPHSKFHPVPARPVFETRASYLPPQPMGVELVPVPDQGFHSMMSDSPPGPPDAMSEAIDARDFDGAGAVILSPPSN